MAKEAFDPSFPGILDLLVRLSDLSDVPVKRLVSRNLCRELRQISLLSRYDPQSIVRFAGRASIGQLRPAAKQKMHNLHTARNFLQT